jgi:hypothetical protein
LSSWIKRIWRGKAAVSSRIEGPARLIHITLGLKQELLSVKLVEANPTQPYQYVALSHCWRFSFPLKMTTKNIRAHKSKFPLSSMSPVLCEAIILAAALEYEYIWIDLFVSSRIIKRTGKARRRRWALYMVTPLLSLQHMGATWALRKSTQLRFRTQQYQVIALPFPREGRPWGLLLRPIESRLVVRTGLVLAREIFRTQDRTIWRSGRRIVL